MMKRLALVSLTAVLACSISAGQDESFGDKVRGLLAEGMDLYKRGKYQEASVKFEEAFQMQPSSDQVYAFIKRAGDDLVAGMMNSPERKMQDVGRRLMELAKPGEPLREKKEVVLKYIEDLKSPSHEIWRNAFFHLKNFGPYCVRFVMPALADKQGDIYRSRVILLLTEMGIDSSQAVIEALDSKNEFVRQQAAIILGNAKDERAIPALKRVIEDGKELPEVKKFANEALRKIIRDVKEASAWKPATDYYYELAMKYYYSHSAAIIAWQRSYLIWKWDAEKDVLTERKVARMVYNEQLAEEALFDLLTLKADHVDQATGLSAWSLLACVQFAMALEARAAVDAALDAMRVDQLDKAGLLRLIRETEGMSEASGEELKKTIEGAADVNAVAGAVTKYFDRMAKVIRANVVAQLPGKKHLYEALSRCLTDGNYLVAKSCIEAIEEMGRQEDLPARPVVTEGGQASAENKEPVAGAGAAPPQHGTLGYPLIEALTSEDKRVRYAAAKAMATLNPQRLKLGMELVIPNLIDALGEQAVRVALVVYDVKDDNDRNFMNGFKKALQGINVFPVVVTSGAEGIVKAKQFPTEDVIILQRKICSQVYFRQADTSKPIVETVFDTLRDDVRTRNIPRIVLGDTDAEVTDAKKEYEEKGTASGVIGKGVNPLDLKAMLEKIFDSPESQKDSKDRANEIAKAAAETFAHIDPSNTLYPYRDAVEGLRKTLDLTVLREDFIRIPAAQALGHFGDQRAIDTLSNVLAEKDADAERAARQKAVRLACVKALSQVFKKTGVTPVEAVFASLKKNLKDGDYDIEFTCAEALGNAILTAAQRLELAKERRIVRDSVTAEDP